MDTGIDYSKYDKLSLKKWLYKLNTYQLTESIMGFQNLNFPVGKGNLSWHPSTSIKGNFESNKLPKADWNPWKMGNRDSFKRTQIYFKSFGKSKENGIRKL